MEPWVSFALAVAGGGVLLAGAALLDRRERKRIEVLRSWVPEREGVAPTYVPADDVLQRPIRLARLDQDQAADLAALLDDATKVQVGWATDRFATHADPPRAILFDPMVVISDEIGAIRELIAALQRSRQLGHPLVLVSGSIDPTTLETLAANRTELDLPVLVVQASAAQLDELRELLGTHGTNRTDLQSGYLPEQVTPVIKLWVAQARESWVA